MEIVQANIKLYWNSSSSNSGASISITAATNWTNGIQANLARKIYVFCTISLYFDLEFETIPGQK